MVAESSLRSLVAWTMAGATLFVPAVIAQSNNTDDGCSRGPNYSHANMSDTAMIDSPDGGDDWRVTITVADGRGPDAVREAGEQEVYLWVDVPEDLYGSEDTSYCPVMLEGGTDRSRSNTGDNSCAGVLSEECIAALKTARSTSDECPQWRTLLENECGDSNSRRGSTSSSKSCHFALEVFSPKVRRA